MGRIRRWIGRGGRWLGRGVSWDGWLGMGEIGRGMRRGGLGGGGR